MWTKNVTSNDFYFCSNICGYTANQCKHYKKFLEDQSMFKTRPQSITTKEDDDEADILKMLGLD